MENKKITHLLYRLDGDALEENYMLSHFHGLLLSGVPLSFGP